MARVIKGSRAKKPVAKARADVRAAPPVRTAAKAVAKSRAAAPAPKLTVAEMRAELEKLTKANATLRAKNRDLAKSTRTAAATIAALQEQVTLLEHNLADSNTPAKPASRRPRRAAAKPDHEAIPTQPAPQDEAAADPTDAENHEPD